MRDFHWQRTPTCWKPSCYAPPTRVCGEGSPPAGTLDFLAASLPAGLPPGSPCPCETPQETPRGWALTLHSPSRHRQHFPGSRENGITRRLWLDSARSRLDADVLSEEDQSCSMQDRITGCWRAPERHLDWLHTNLCEQESAPRVLTADPTPAETRTGWRR